MKKRLLALGLAFVLCLGALPEALASGQPFTNKDQALDLAVDSLMDAVFAAEYANDQGGYMVRWASPLRVFAGGEYTQQDLDTLNSFINELSNRVIWLPDISMVYDVSQSNVTFAFAPLNDMAGFDMPGYVEGDWGAFSYWFEDNLINRAVIAIASDVTEQEDRNYLIKMKLVNILGLTNRIAGPKDSILYEEWTGSQDLSQVDWLTLNLLYEPWLSPGIGAQEAFSFLSRESLQ